MKERPELAVSEIEVGAPSSSNICKINVQPLVLKRQRPFAFLLLNVVDATGVPQQCFDLKEHLVAHARAYQGWKVEGYIYIAERRCRIVVTGPKQSSLQRRSGKRLTL